MVGVMFKFKEVVFDGIEWEFGIEFFMGVGFDILVCMEEVYE